MLEIRNFSKSYSKGKNVVEDISLKVNNGEIYGFVGHNGAGKTTTIKSIVGILDFQQGDILIDNMSIKNKPLECKKVMAYIPDNPDIYEALTGIQYLNFIADIYKVSKEQREELIRLYGDRFELTPYLGDLISSYSHGMKQKVAIISALIHEPKLMVMDEPFVGLDPKATFILKEIMHDMCKKGAAVFFSTHVLDVAEKLCNKVAIIKKGQLIASGTMEELTNGQSLESVFMEVVNE